MMPRTRAAAWARVRGSRAGSASTTAVGDGPAPVAPPLFVPAAGRPGPSPPDVQPVSSKPHTATAQPRRAADPPSSTKYPRGSPGRHASDLMLGGNRRRAVGS